MYLIVLYSSGVVTNRSDAEVEGQRWGGGEGQCGHSGHWTTRKQDFFWNWISPKAAVLYWPVWPGQEAAARYICMRESWAELTRADRQQDNSAGDTADTLGGEQMIYLNI